MYHSTPKTVILLCYAFYNNVCFILAAYACYHTNETDACLLHLLKLEHLAVSTQLKVRRHLLHGLLLAKQGRHFEALQEFFKPLSIVLQDTQEKKDFYPVTLYYIAEQYETLHSTSEAHSQSDVKTVQDNRQCSSQQTKSLHASLRADHLDTLQHLVQVSVKCATEPVSWGSLCNFGVNKTV
jgi:hypothetical protein